MNETTNLNSELLSADARGRKHIPFAVFAVILVHVVLFLVLLIAAGCRAKARARRNAQPPSVATATAAEAPVQNASAAVQPVLPLVTPSINAASASSANAALAPAANLNEPVVATEPPPEKRSTTGTTTAGIKKAKPVPSTESRPAAARTAKARIYVVKAGDTVEKIAKMHRTSVQAITSENNLKNHLLRPGQQLRVSSQKTKTSNEV